MILKRLNKTQNLDPYKAHGNGKSSIRMIKIWGKSICKSL